MLRACIIDSKVNWYKYLHLKEFAYNNSFHSSIFMDPYEALYVGDVDTQLDSLKWVSLHFWVLI